MTLLSMSSLRRFLCLCLLLWWLPATMHCTLESAFPQGVKIPCPYDKDDGSPSDPDCPSCATLCKDLYLGQEAPIEFRAPGLCAIQNFFIQWRVLPPAVVPERPLEINGSPPRVMRLWTFVVNTALPVRGPSLFA